MGTRVSSLSLCFAYHLVPFLLQFSPTECLGNGVGWLAETELASYPPPRSTLAQPRDGQRNQSSRSSEKVYDYALSLQRQSQYLFTSFLYFNKLELTDRLHFLCIPRPGYLSRSRQVGTKIVVRPFDCFISQLSA